MRTISNTKRIIAATLATCSLACLAQAHEFWVQPKSHIITPGGLLGVTLMHGERFMGDPVARNSPMIARYELVAPDHEPVRIAGMHGQPDGFIRSEHAGVLVYQTRHYRNDLPADEFHAYLKEEGLDEIAQRRDQLGESDKTGREVYSRCAKSIIHLDGGETDASAIDHDTGLPLEITLRSISHESDKPVVTASVKFLGAPMPDMRVVAVHANSPETLIELQTNADGEVRFEGDPGHWMLTTLHIRRADTVEDAEWESFWASNTFMIADEK